MKLLLSPAVAEQAVFLCNGLDRKSLALAVLDRVAWPKTNPPKRSVVAGILPILPAGLELHNDRARRQLQDGSQPQFRLALADPSLSGVKVVGHRV